MKTTYTKFILLLAATTFIACNEEEAPSLHIYKFTICIAYQKNERKGA